MCLVTQLMIPVCYGKKQEWAKILEKLQQMQTGMYM